jgi:hypothetical protein
VSHSFGYIPRSVIAGSYGRSMFRFLTKLQETRRAPTPLSDASAQTAWEDLDHKESKAAHSTPTNNPGPDQRSPLDKPTPTQGKKKN